LFRPPRFDIQKSFNGLDRVLAFWVAVMYFMHMKRTNIAPDEDRLEEAVRLAGAKTYSRAVDRALRDFIRRARAHRILKLAGSGF
jgi:Arc/MetJ family transcription regulator